VALGVMIPVIIILVTCVKFDPLDADLLINEQAIYMTSNFSNKFRDTLKLSDFKSEFKEKI